MIHLEHLKAIARQHRVKRLELFGSVARGEPARDHDFLVEFEPMTALEHGRAYFALLYALELEVGPVNLIELEAVKNPSFLELINQNRMYSTFQPQITTPCSKAG
jgi:uncharacterized protein